MTDRKNSKSLLLSAEKDSTYAEPSFYSDIFNRKQNIFCAWNLWNFSEVNLDFFASETENDAILNKWITKEIKILVECWYPDEDFDTRRFAKLYNKGIKYNEIRKTANLPDSLFFILQGMFQYRHIRSLDKNIYKRMLANWPDLFFPNNKERLDKASCHAIENELRKFKKDIETILEKCFEIPLPRIRSYQGFIFAANFLFECLRYNKCPTRRKTQFDIFSLITFKSIFNFCYNLPLEYPVLHNIAYHFQELRKFAENNKGISDGCFLDFLFKYIDSEFAISDKSLFPELDKYKVPDKYIKNLTQDFSQDRLHYIAKDLSDKCGDDCNGIIYEVLRQAAVGLILSERTDDKNILTSLLEHDQKKSNDSDLPLILYLIAAGLNSYSTAMDYQRTRLANEFKKSKNSRSIKE